VVEVLQVVLLRTVRLGLDVRLGGALRAVLDDLDRRFIAVGAGLPGVPGVDAVYDWCPV